MDNILHFIPTLSKIATKINGNLINWRWFMKWWPSAVQTPKECNRAVREIFTCSPSKKNQHIRSLVSVDLPETWWVQCWRKTWTFNPGNYITYRSYLWRTATDAWNTEKLFVHDMKTGLISFMMICGTMRQFSMSLSFVNQRNYHYWADYDCDSKTTGENTSSIKCDNVVQHYLGPCHWSCPLAKHHEQ